MSDAQSKEEEKSDSSVIMHIYMWIAILFHTHLSYKVFADT